MQFYNILNVYVRLLTLLRFIVSLVGVQLRTTRSGETRIGDILDEQEFENFFRDSGYWDFFLLSFFDYFFRVYIIYTLLVVSDFAIVEKASWLLVGMIFWPINLWSFLELASLEEFFMYIIFWILIFTSIVFFTAGFLTFIA